MICSSHFSDVSTHAPARGATTTSSNVLGRYLFQPTHPHGVRRSNACLRIHSCWFQPTHPHGVRRLISVPAFPHGCFNPRTRTGCDCPRGGSGAWCICFNPRTRTGCDLDGRKIPDETIKCFNPRTRTGCDATILTLTLTGGDVSTHAPARGATSPPPPLIHLLPVSTHAPARGATFSRRRD